MKQRRLRFAIALACLMFSLPVTDSSAADWTQWAGNNRDGIWTESEILDRFPEGGLKVTWRTPIGSGYSGPVVAEGRVFTMDYRPKPGTKILEAIERVLCLDEETGDILWTHEWETHYRRQMHSYATGPRASPVVDEDRIYTFGATGRIHCLDVKTGKVRWEIDCVEQYQTEIPMFGVSCSPLVDGNKVYYVTGGSDGGQLKAYDKLTGKELWRALPTDYELAYSPPVIYEAGGVRQLILWDRQAVHGLNPETGQSYWKQPFETRGMAIGQPVRSGPFLLVSCFYTGSMLLRLDESKPAADVVWKVGGEGEMPNKTRGLHAIITTPIIEGDHFYGTCSYGELRGLRLSDSERLWTSEKLTRQGRWGSLFWVKQGDRYFVNNDFGELLIMQFTPEGPIELDRTKLIEPDTNCGYGPRRFAAAMVNWVYPAYANRHIVIRNDSEILRASLAKE